MALPLALLCLALALGHCPHQTRPAAPLAPHPYFPLDPGITWAFEVTAWDYPSRLDTAPLAITLEQTFRIVSLEPEDRAWRIRTEPALTALFFPAGLISEPAEWLQDGEGLWMIWNSGKRKSNFRVLVLPVQPDPGRSWQATTPEGIELQFRIAAGPPSDEPPLPEENHAELDPAGSIGLEIEISAPGQACLRRLQFARDLGPIRLEDYSFPPPGPRLLAQWRRSDLSPFPR